MAAGTVLVLRAKTLRDLNTIATFASKTGRLLFPCAHFLINHVSMHGEGVLFKHFQLALDPVLRA